MGHKYWAGPRGRPSLLGCSHAHTVSTVTAGLERMVCEGCGRVSLRYAGDGAFWPDAPGVSRSAPGQPRCGTCGGAAIFLTPAGIACSQHAWAAASNQEFLGPGFWIPRLIDGARSRRLMDDLAVGEGSVMDLTWRERDDQA